MKTCRATNQVHRAILRMLDPTQFEEFLRNLGSDVAEILHVDAIKLVLESPEAGPDPALERISDVLVVVEPGFVDDYINLGHAPTSRQVILRQAVPATTRLYGQRAADLRSEACLRLDLWHAAHGRDAGHGVRQPAYVQAGAGHGSAVFLRGHLREVDAPLAGMIAPALGDALTRFLQRKQSLDGGVSQYDRGLCDRSARLSGVHGAASGRAGQPPAPWAVSRNPTCALGWRMRADRTCRHAPWRGNCLPCAALRGSSRMTPA